MREKPTFFSLLARRKWTVAVTGLLAVAAAAVFSLTLPKVYSASAQLLVALPADTQSFDTVQASQAIGRSYAEILDSPNVADRVAAEIPDATRGEIGDAISAEPIPDTQLLEVTGEGSTPERARLIANTYAEIFIEYARENLAPTTTAAISLADSAPLPESPSRPRPRLYALIAGLLGLALGMAIAALREGSQRRLRTFEDVEAVVDVPVLARIPRRRSTRPSSQAFEEASRLLHTNLQFVDSVDGLSSLAITSADEAEGKTMIAAGLAMAAAESGSRVLAVEGDLRRPALQQHVVSGSTKRLIPGLSNYLVGSVSDPAEVTYSTDVADLEIVPAGSLPPNPSVLLESDNAKRSVSRLAHKANLMVVDCPPLSVGADASLITSWVAGVILVVDLEKSTDKNLRQALMQLKAVHGRVVGVVVNRDKDAMASAYRYTDGRPALRRVTRLRDRLKQ